MARILAVDDQRVMRELVKSVLEGEGHEVVIAEDGIEAMSIARENSFDLVLTDINMPNMNGISLVSKLRRLDTFATIPIIMLTTESADFKKDKAKRMGANGWLQKPFDPDRLVKAVTSSLARAGHVVPARS
ncbi:MAG: response regulator [Candidatus Polarisedimenticolaceae bacterium]|nr:response regulator [Candidatus Polarisedimenticolaceae bacterium]